MENFYQGCYCDSDGKSHPCDTDSMSLAMAYVPWQHWKQVYCPEEGLRCGTIFPELNKPFYGRAGCPR